MKKVLSEKKYLYRFMGISATLAAVLISIADVLLEFTKDFKISSEFIDPNWASMAEWRFDLSISLCAFAIPFYILGFWLLYNVLKKSHPKLAIIIFVMFSYGLMMGGNLIHTVMNYYPIIYQFGTKNALDMNIISDLITGSLTDAILPVFIFHYILTWVIAPILLMVVILSGKTQFKRWQAFISPFIFLIVLSLGTLVYPQVFAYLTPGAINKGNAALFFLLTIKTWNFNE